MLDVFEIINETPHGSVISPVLFNIMINGIFMNLDRRIASALYADDGAVWIRGRESSSAPDKLKEAIVRVNKWSFNWGLKASPSNSCYICFYKKEGTTKPES